MSESYGGVLKLKRHEDLEKVATYVKQQVREKSLELVGKDLSVNSDYVGLIIDEEEDKIIWHDFGLHGDHLDFSEIANCLIKEIPDVDMELRMYYGLDGDNYMIVDGEWQEYTPWNFVTYVKDNGDKVLLEYKEMKDGLTDEEKRKKRDKMCKELAEQQSRQQPGVEIAVFCYDYNELFSCIEEFYSAKDGCVTHQHVDAGLVEIMSCGYFDEMDWVKSYGEALLYPLNFLAEIIKRVRKGDDYCPLYATRMMLYGNTAHYFSLIESSDKEWLMKQVEEHNDIGAICCLLFGMNNKFQYWNEPFVDEDTHEEVTLLRYDPLEGSTFEKQEGEEARLVQIIIDEPYLYSADEIMRVYKMVPNKIELLQICVDKHSKEAASEMYEKFYYGDEEHGIFINRKKAKEYYDLAGDAAYDEWNDSNDPGEEDPSTYEYTLTGNADTLNGIRKTIDDLCQKFGTPGNELGLYVPQRLLMKLLVGSDTEYYRGNILTMEQPAPNNLVITTEADSGYPLLYALRQCFENLEITMKETG